MKALVWGGTGWLGHHIARAFHGAGHAVTVCSRGRATAFARQLPEGVRTLHADKENAADVAAIFDERFDVVLDSVPSETSIDNIARHAGRFKRYLHCSSTGGYAPLPFLPGDETMPYDHFLGGWKAKGLVDAKAMDLFCRRGLAATVLRPTYITGPGLPPLDNLGDRRADFIPDVLNRVPLDLPNDGQALLQPVHVADVARCFVLAAQEPHSIGQIYNVSGAKAVTLTRYLQITAASLQREAVINYLPLEELVQKYRGVTDEIGLRFVATHSCFDIGKARRQLGYAPGHTVEEAIEETARWAAAPIEKQPAS